MVGEKEMDFDMELPKDDEIPSDQEVEDESDPISEALFDLLSDEGMDLIWDVIGELVDDGEIEDIPEEGSSVEDQKQWIDNNLGKVKEKFKEVIGNDEAE